MAVLCEKRTNGQVESMVSDGIVRFHLESFGRGPEETRTHILGSLVLVVVRGSLTLVERNLVGNGNGHLVRDARRSLVSSARCDLEDIIESSLGVRPNSVHYDLSAEIDEEMIAFSLGRD